MQNKDAAPIQSAELAGFDAAWPEIHNAGYANGWRGVALAAWKAALAAVSATPAQPIADVSAPTDNAAEIRAAYCKEYALPAHDIDYDCLQWTAFVSGFDAARAAAPTDQSPYEPITLANLRAGKLSAARMYVGYCELSEELKAAKGAIERYKALAASTGASQSAGADADELSFNAQRLRNVAELVGVNVSTLNDETVDGARGALLGEIAGKLRERATHPAAMPAQASVVPEAVREALRDALSAALGDAMDCTRVWRAWQSGTMDETDFHLIADNDERLDELVDAVLAVAPPAPAPAIQAQPLTDAAIVNELARADVGLQYMHHSEKWTTRGSIDLSKLIDAVRAIERHLAGATPARGGE